MADLLSHVLIAHVVKRLSPWPRGVLAFAIGTTLPDVAGRVPRVVLNILDRTGEASLPPLLGAVWGVLHVPVPFVVLCTFLALLFPIQEQRVSLFRNLCLGGLLHLAVDFLQVHIDGGSYPIFFPVSIKGYELGWVSTEASLDWIPWLVPAALMAEGWYRRRAREQDQLP